MKVLLVNGSCHEKGCTYTALAEVAKALNENGVETEIYQLGGKKISGCNGCWACKKIKKCVVEDGVNEFVEKAAEFDGFVFGSPVYYASASGNLVSFMDRVFYSGGKFLAYKPAAAVVSCRRAGASTTFDVINKYFTINNMPIVGSNYWNEIHGNTAEEAAQDEEGLQTMRVLGNNMAWLLKCLQLGKDAGIEPVKERKIMTNFIR
ncbi:MAG: flavodoxin family protein [Clostridia bacterium]|nr:flavodoxin family protein [Clostridia bacterium]MBQ8447130.1 flavodoxin family protein [Clostridia bacterium]MBQ8447265.1 flavodoxin family protein [Clostridia bacterium]